MCLSCLNDVGNSLIAVVCSYGLMLEVAVAVCWMMFVI